MKYYRLRYEDMKELCNCIFGKLGFSNEDRQTISDIILESDLRGIESHGIQRLKFYYNKVKKRAINMNPDIKVIQETPISAVLDADNGMGQLVAARAMNLAISKAKTSGIGMVVVKNSNHFGIAGYYPTMAQKEGMIGVCMTNSEAIIPPTWGIKPMMGSNPISVAMSAEPYPFILDMSTSVVPRGKVEVYNKRNTQLPSGWAIGKNGDINQNAGEVLSDITGKLGGGILPLGGLGEIFGGHKGYGIALLVEMLTSIIANGVTSNHHTAGTTCESFFAIDYGIFGDKKTIENNLSTYFQEIRNSDKASGADRIYIPGEKEAEACKNRMEKGLLANEATVKEIEDICRNEGIAMPDFIEE
jgi:LDH2 family malate/lactate/ureidoglycolate dehydrogenase